MRTLHPWHVSCRARAAPQVPGPHTRDVRRNDEEHYDNLCGSRNLAGAHACASVPTRDAGISLHLSTLLRRERTFARDHRTFLAPALGLLRAANGDASGDIDGRHTTTRTADRTFQLYRPDSVPRTCGTSEHGPVSAIYFDNGTIRIELNECCEQGSEGTKPRGGVLPLTADVR